MMKLLSIEEPRMRAGVPIGIDLGTTHSALSSARGDDPVPVEVDGRYLVPSVVGCIDGELVAGIEATGLNDVWRSSKRVIGLAGQEDTFINGQVVTAQAAAAAILRKLKKHAMDVADGALGQVVVTVPANFDDVRRRSTRQAAIDAGLPHPRLIAEPTAAALAYRLDRDDSVERALVFDFGGGTFDVSVLDIDGEIMDVVSTAGDVHLGGDDVDDALADQLLSRLPLEGSAAIDRADAVSVARSAKEALSTQDDIEITMGSHVLRVTADDVDAVAKPLIDRAMRVVHDALDAAGCLEDGPPIDRCILAGGSSYLRSVRRTLEEMFPGKVLCDLDPELIVALGAGRLARMIQTKTGGVVLDVLPLSLGIEIGGGLVERVLPRNTPIPVKKAQTFTTQRAGQTGIALHIVQGERELSDDCRSLARGSIRVPPKEAGVARVTVTFDVDADGILTVKAVEADTGEVREFVVTHDRQASAADIDAALQTYAQNREGDAEAAALRAAADEGQRMAWSILDVLKSDGRLASDEERARLTRSAHQLLALCDGSDQHAIAAVTKDLQIASTELAERRMDVAVKKALVGHSADGVS